MQDSFVKDSALPLVLCVDDDPVCRSLLECTLAQAGLQTLVCDSGLSALKVVRDHAVALAVLDYDMPGMNGPELAANLRLVQPQIPLVLCSANLDRNISELSLFDALYLKASHGSNLARILHDLLHKSTSVQSSY